MQADVERFAFDPKKRFLRVIEQQGRVALAADTNEQTSILLDYSRRVAADVIGAFGTPAGESNDAPGPGFQIDAAQGKVLIRGGVYWVDGLRCVNDEDVVEYASQVDYPDAPAIADGVHLLYLDAWERHVAAAQDPSIRDVALGGPDTASRSALVWQVKAHAISEDAARADFDEVYNKSPAAPVQPDGLWATWRDEIEPADRGYLAVDAKPADAPADPCGAAPGSGYVGNENQHYRVEIHRGSLPSGQADDSKPPTFKWSRDNGSVVYPLHALDGAIATLLDPPIDCRKQLVPGSLVELVDDWTALMNRPGHLARVVDVDDDGDDVLIQLDPEPPAGFDATRHPMLRRWDHADVRGGGDGVPTVANDGALLIVEGDDEWLTLEDGIRIRFAGLAESVERRYRTGDYWTFPARAALGDVIWPETADVPDEVAPHGIDRAYAPLAIVQVADGGLTTAPVDLRWGFARLATLRPPPPT